MIKVAVSGAAGRMGQAVCEAVESADDTELVGRADPAIGSELAGLLGDAEVVVDFSTPDAAPVNVRSCLEAGVHAVVGTTGFDLDGLR
jgi:4-hydroxy-tetrahydrodipicolinate reductase